MGRYKEISLSREDITTLRIQGQVQVRERDLGTLKNNDLVTTWYQGRTRREEYVGCIVRELPDKSSSSNFATALFILRDNDGV